MIVETDATAMSGEFLVSDDRYEAPEKVSNLPVAINLGRHVEEESQPDTIFENLAGLRFQALLYDLDACDPAQGSIRSSQHGLRSLFETRRARSDNVADLADPHRLRPQAHSRRIGVQARTSLIKLARPSGNAPACFLDLHRGLWHIRENSKATMRKPSFPETATPLRSEQSAKVELRPSNPALDLIAFSSVLPAVIAAGLSLAASHAIGATDSPRWAVLATSGTFIVYGLDRLRDTDRDRVTSPKRTYFVENHARAILIAVGLAALVLVAALLTSPAPVALICGGIGAIGLLHRRLKGSKSLKSIYVTLAWVAICAGIPAIATPDSARFGWVAVILSTGIAANLLASNLGDDPTSPPRGHLPSILGLARSLAIVGVLIAWAAPIEIAPLGWIPFAEAVALAFYHPNEHYEHLAVDGALLAGALASLIHFRLG